MCSRVEELRIFQHVLEAVKFVDNVEKELVLLRGPLMQKRVGIQEPFSKGEGLLPFFFLQEDISIVIELHQLHHALHGIQHALLMPDLFSQHGFAHHQHGREQVFCFTAFDAQCGKGLVWLLDISKHREAKVAQPGGAAKFFVCFPTEH